MTSPPTKAGQGMYRSQCLKRSDLKDGRVYEHGIARMNVSPFDVKTFIEPTDAALVFGFRTLTPEQAVEQGLPVWMVTLRRRAGHDAIVECLQRVFAQIADEASLVEVLVDTGIQARILGYRRLCFSPALYGEPLFPTAVKRVAERLGKPVKVRITTGLTSIAL
jgi:hypothetical protein